MTPLGPGFFNSSPRRNALPRAEIDRRYTALRADAATRFVPLRHPRNSEAAIQAAFENSRVQRSHVNNKAVTDVALQHTFIGFIDILDRDHLNFRNNIVLAAEVEHFLGFLDRSDH